MSLVESEVCTSPATGSQEPRLRLPLPQPRPRVPPTELVKLCYTLVHAAEAVGIRDLADGEYLPTDKTLEAGIERQLNYLLDQGGYYPVEGQLEQCAKPYFSLQAEMDGSAGYKIANDYRMARMLRGLYTNPRVVWRIFRSLLRHPWVTGTMIECYFLEKSWDWQFWGNDPPMKLLRHTWRRNPAAVE